MTGGVLRGQAFGNVFNHADGKDNIYIGPRKGRVLIYQSPKDPMNHKLDMSITSEVTSQLKPVLKSLAWRYSPVWSKWYSSFGKIFNTNTLLELNSWIFIYEDDTWAVKGRYQDALEDNDDVMWTFDGGYDKLYLLIVSNSFFFTAFLMLW